MLYRSASAGLASTPHAPEALPQEPLARLVGALHDWKDAAPDAAEHAGRREAVRRILHNTLRREPELNLESLSLSSFPQGLQALRWLRVVRAADNRIASLPHEFSATRITLIDLRRNPLTLDTHTARRGPQVLTD